jgi:hypothetical protein
MRNLDLIRLFLRRLVDNDLISPDADRLQVLSQVGGLLITGGLFVTIPLSLGHLTSPYPLPRRTAVEMVRIQFLYVAWTMTVMALVAVSVWDALSLDHRDTQILGPLPLVRGVIVRAKIAALVVFAGSFAVTLNLLPALIHPVFAVSRLKPSLVSLVTLIAAHITSTTAAAAFGFGTVLGLRELLQALLGSAGLRRVSVPLHAALVVALVTILLLVPGFSFRVTDTWLAGGGMATNLLPPMWFVGLHDVVSGHIWAQLPDGVLPPRMAASERAFAELYQSRRPLLDQLGVVGAGSLLVVLLVSAVAYLWNHRRLPDVPQPRTGGRGRLRIAVEALVMRLVARAPLVRAGYSFTAAVVGRSVRNRLSIAVPLAVALAFATVSLRIDGMQPSSADLSSAPTAVLAVQLLFIAALVTGFRRSIRVPADLRARWVFHLVRPANQRDVQDGAKRAAIVKLVVPVLLALTPLHLLAFGVQTTVLQFAYGVLAALVAIDAALLAFSKLPFASSYVPIMRPADGPIYGVVALIGVYAIARIEQSALGSGRGIVILFGTTAACWIVVRLADARLRRSRVNPELDELVDVPTLRLGLTD